MLEVYNTGTATRGIGVPGVEGGLHGLAGDTGGVAQEGHDGTAHTGTQYWSY